jgi:hypothetical protein
VTAAQLRLQPALALKPQDYFVDYARIDAVQLVCQRRCSGPHVPRVVKIALNWRADHGQAAHSAFLPPYLFSAQYGT